jgi:hypothetical protein
MARDGTKETQNTGHRYPPCSTCLEPHVTGLVKPEPRRHTDTDKPFSPGLRSHEEVFSVDKTTKTQISIVSFIMGLIMLFVPYLKNFDSVIPGISQYFSLMFYLGLLLIIAGYYLK